MTYRIHFKWPDGTDDSIILSGDDMDALRAQMREEMAKRGVDLNTCWSEPL